MKLAGQQSDITVSIVMFDSHSELHYGNTWPGVSPRELGFGVLYLRRAGHDRAAAGRERVRFDLSHGGRVRDVRLLLVDDGSLCGFWVSMGIL